MVYPAYGLIFAKGIEGFSYDTAAKRTHAGDRNALWFFIISIVATAALGVQNYAFGASAAVLTGRLRTMSFKAILRQDGECSNSLAV